jgi:hypothetical protein
MVKKIVSKKLLVFAATGILLSSCAFFGLGPDSNGPNDSIDDSTAKSILRNLNVNEVDNPTDLKTTPAGGGDQVLIDDPDEWHPLKKPYSVFSPKSEVMQIGISHDGANQTLFEDSSEAYSASHPIPSGNDWVLDKTKISTAADLDGDGIDEIVVLYTKCDPDEEEPEGRCAGLMVYNDGSFSDTYTIPTTGANSIQVSTYADNEYNNGVEAFFPHWRLESADVNGDGIDELLFTNYKTLRIMSVPADGSSLQVLDKKAFDHPVSSFTGGDCDGDGKDELIVGLEGGSFAIYDSSMSSPLLNPEFTNPGVCSFTEGVFGDFDGDNIDEIAVVQVDISDNSITLMSYSFNEDTLTMVAGPEELSLKLIFPLPWSIDIGVHGWSYSSGVHPLPQALDLDGDGSYELSVGAAVFNNVLESFGSENRARFELPASTDDEILAHKCIGDVNGDAREDIICHTWLDHTGLGTPVELLSAYGTTEIQDWDQVNALENAEYINRNTGSTRYQALSNTSLAVGNFDDDSDRVRYTGHELQFTNPIVIATLASAPYYRDIAASDDSYNFQSWQTTFGKTTASSATDTSKVGFSIGSTVEVEQGINVFGVEVASFKASSSFSKNTSWEWSTTSSISKSITYTCNGGEDRVIFTAVPMDIYSYEIVGSSDPADLWQKLYIKLPRDYSTYTVTKAFFNGNNGDLTDLPDEVLPHTKGDPSTYPNTAAKNTLMTEYPNGYEIGPSPAAQGDGFSGITEMEIVVEQANEKTISTDFTTETSIGGGAGGVTVALDMGFNTGYGYTTTSSQGTSFGGTVGFLPSSFYSNPNYSYSSGLFVLPYKDTKRDNATGQSWWAINYWVE